MAGQAFFLAAGMGRIVAVGTEGVPEEVGPAGRPPKRVVPVMAGQALPDPGVAAFEEKAGLGVIEIPGIERNELRVRAFVFGVAGPAAFGLVPVEAPAFLDARGDLFMAGQAFLRSGVPVGSVTGGAGRDPRLLGVEGAERPRGFGDAGFLRSGRARREPGHGSEGEGRERGDEDPGFLPGGPILSSLFPII